MASFCVNPEITPVLTMALKVFGLYYVNIIDFILLVKTESLEKLQSQSFP